MKKEPPFYLIQIKKGGIFSILINFAASFATKYKIEPIPIKATTQLPKSSKKEAYSQLEFLYSLH